MRQARKRPDRRELTAATIEARRRHGGGKPVKGSPPPGVQGTRERARRLRQLAKQGKEPV